MHNVARWLRGGATGRYSVIIIHRYRLDLPRQMDVTNSDGH